LKIGFCMPAIALLLQDWYTLWHFRINAHSPTRRGRRSGTRKIRAIAVIITKHGQCNQTPSRGCQIGNLVPVYCCEFITTLIRQRYMSPTPACSLRKPPVANQRNLVQINITRQPAFRREQSAKMIKMVTLKCRSVANKRLSIANFIISRDVVIMALTETWLSHDNDKHILHDLVPLGYKMLQVSRSSGRRGGGVALIFKSNLKGKSVKTHSFDQLQHMHCTVVFTDTCLDLFVVYRPPPLRANGLKTSDFFDDWSIFLDAQILKSWDIPITGDFNLHLDVPNNPDAMRFNNLFDVHGLKQHVNEPTHMLGHTLDLIIARDLSRLLCDAVAVVDPGLTDSRDNYSGDHFAIFASLNFNKPSRHRKTVTFRKYASINHTDFRTDIWTALKTCLPHDDAASLVEIYTRACSDTIELHAPLITKVVTIRPDTAWYTKELWLAKTLRRKFERCWRKTGLAAHLALDKVQ